eukprot:2348718-Rhodomonas_salina.1
MWPPRRGGPGKRVRGIMQRAAKAGCQSPLSHSLASWVHGRACASETRPDSVPPLPPDSFPSRQHTPSLQALSLSPRQPCSSAENSRCLTLS